MGVCIYIYMLLFVLYWLYNIYKLVLKVLYSEQELHWLLAGPKQLSQNLLQGWQSFSPFSKNFCLQGHCFESLELSILLEVREQDVQCSAELPPSQLRHELWHCWQTWLATAVELLLSKYPTAQGHVPFSMLKSNLFDPGGHETQLLGCSPLHV